MSTPAKDLGEGSGRKEVQANDNPPTPPKPPKREFFLTDNPREGRVLNALMVRSRTRKHTDEIAGASNAPDLIKRLRDRGLEIPCDKMPAFDRDELKTEYGVYHLTEVDRRKIRKAMKVRDTRRAA